MGRPLRYAFEPKDVDRQRWPHAVATSLRLIRSDKGRAVLDAEIVDWLRASVRRGGWRFAAWTSRLGIRVVGLQKPIYVVATLTAEVCFSQDNDAVAFKLRWG